MENNEKIQRFDDQTKMIRTGLGALTFVWSRSLFFSFHHGNFIGWFIIVACARVNLTFKPSLMFFRSKTIKREYGVVK